MWPFTTKQPPVHEAKFQSSALMVGMGSARWTQHNFRQLAIEGFETNPIVYACVTKLAKAISSTDLHLYDYTRQGDLRKIDRHEILDLITNPNSLWSGRQFLEKLATHYLIGGNSYLLGDKGDSEPPNQLWLLPSEYVEVKAKNGAMMPLGYSYNPGGDNPVFYPVNQVTGKSAVCHLKTANPLNEFVGLSPMAPASRAIDILNEGMRWNMSLLQNDARPSGVLKVLQPKDGAAATLSDEQYNRLREQIDDQYTGSGNTGRPMLLEGGLDWSQLALNAKDMDHMENMLSAARLIAACYGTPPQLVNIPGESTYSNYEQATMAYWSDTVLPLLGTILEDINRWLMPLFGERGTFLWYDEEQIPALEPRRKEKSTRINASEFMTVNEKREAMNLEVYKEPSEPGADSIFINSKDLPIEMAGKLDPLLHPALASDPAAPAPKPAAKPTGIPDAKKSVE